MRSKEKILSLANSLVFRGRDKTTPGAKLAPTDRAKLIVLNVELLEHYMPHDDPVIQRRAKRTIANLEKQILMRP